LTHGAPTSPGVPRGCTDDTCVLRFNDLEQLQTAFAKEGDRIEAVIVEPVVGNMGLVPPSAGFLAELRRETIQYGAVLVFDEVMTGFRLAFGGAQELFGIQPDLTVLGKIVGGGLPVGAYGGRADIMKCVSPVGPVYQAGTLSGNPLAMAAGIATLRELKEKPPYEGLESLGRQLETGIAQEAQKAGIPQHFARVGSMWTLFFASEPVVDYESAKLCNTASFARFFWGMLDRGFYLPCSQFEAAFLMPMHTPEQIDQTIAAAKEVLTTHT
jgi:glutamate-1-semialdehyde 2,1-aminomutase